MEQIFLVLGLLSPGDFKPCQCVVNQNMQVVGETEILVKGTGDEKCMVDLTNLIIEITPEDDNYLNKKYGVTLVSSKRGEIEGYVLSGFTSSMRGWKTQNLIIQQRFVAKKNEKIWFKVKTVTESEPNFLFSMSKMY